MQTGAGGRTAWKRGHGTSAGWEILHRGGKILAYGRASRSCRLPEVAWLRHVAGEPGTPFWHSSFSPRVHRATQKGVYV